MKTWLRRTLQSLRLWWSRHKERIAYVFSVATFLLYLFLYFYTVNFVPLTMGLIFRTAQSFLTVEGILFGLLGLTDARRWRDTAVFFGAISLIVSVITIILSDALQSLPAVTSDMAILFGADALLFGLLLEVYFLALLSPPRRRRRR